MPDRARLLEHSRTCMRRATGDVRPSAVVEGERPDGVGMEMVERRVKAPPPADFPGVYPNFALAANGSELATLPDSRVHAPSRPRFCPGR